MAEDGDFFCAMEGACRDGKGPIFNRVIQLHITISKFTKVRCFSHGFHIGIPT